MLKAAMIRTIALTAVLALSACSVRAADLPVYDYTVVKTYPHDTGAYTQGLFYKDGALFEGTGGIGRSSIRKVDLETGEVMQRHALPMPYFGEGIVDWHDTLIQLTWQSQTGFVYDLETFTAKSRFGYAGEGWGLTRDEQQLYMSDGTNVLRILNPDTLAQTGSIRVTANGVPVPMLNELEWVKGEIYANVWMTDRIARIDPATGKVIGWIDLSGLFDTRQLPDAYDSVLNGIAYDAKGDRLFVTGKRWPKLFEITLHQRSQTPAKTGAQGGTQSVDK